MIEPEMKSFLQLCHDDGLKGGTITITWQGVKRPDEIEAQSHELFATDLPSVAKKLQAVQDVAISSVLLNWKASGRKEPRSYRIRITRADRETRHERVIDMIPEPIVAEDMCQRMLAVGHESLQQAAATIAVPFRRLEEVLDHYKHRIEDQEGTIKIRDIRIRELEIECQKKTDEQRSYLGQYAESTKLQAQASAITLEAQANASAMNRLGDAVGDAVTNELPKLGALLMWKLTDGKLGGIPLLGDNKTGEKPNPTTAQLIATAGRVTALPSEVMVRVRALGLDDMEISRLLIYVFLTCPEGDTLELLRPETRAGAVALVPAITAHFRSMK